MQLALKYFRAAARTAFGLPPQREQRMPMPMNFDLARPVDNTPGPVVTKSLRTPLAAQGSRRVRRPRSSNLDHARLEKEMKVVVAFHARDRSVRRDSAQLSMKMRENVEPRAAWAFMSALPQKSGHHGKNVVRFTSSSSSVPLRFVIDAAAAERLKETAVWRKAKEMALKGDQQCPLRVYRNIRHLIVAEWSGKVITMEEVFGALGNKRGAAVLPPRPARPVRLRGPDVGVGMQTYAMDVHQGEDAIMPGMTPNTVSPAEHAAPSSSMSPASLPTPAFVSPTSFNADHAANTTTSHPTSVSQPQDISQVKAASAAPVAVITTNPPSSIALDVHASPASAPLLQNDSAMSSVPPSFVPSTTVAPEMAHMSTAGTTPKTTMTVCAETTPAQVAAAHLSTVNVQPTVMQVAPAMDGYVALQGPKAVGEAGMGSSSMRSSAGTLRMDTDRASRSTSPTSTVGQGDGDAPAEGSAKKRRVLRLKKDREPSPERGPTEGDLALKSLCVESLDVLEKKPKMTSRRAPKITLTPEQVLEKAERHKREKKMREKNSKRMGVQNAEPIASGQRSRPYDRFASQRLTKPALKLEALNLEAYKVETEDDRPTRRSLDQTAFARPVAKLSDTPLSTIYHAGSSSANGRDGPGPSWGAMRK